MEKQIQAASQLLNDREAAKFLGVSEQTLAVWRCTKRYNLKYLKIGRCVRYRLIDLVQWMDQRCRGSLQTEQK